MQGTRVDGPLQRPA